MTLVAVRDVAGYDGVLPKWRGKSVGGLRWKMDGANYVLVRVAAFFL